MHLQITILTEQLKLSQEQFGKCDTSKSILFIGIIWQYVPKESHYQKNNCASTDTLLYYFPRAQSINSPIHNFGFPTPLLTNITSSITIDPPPKEKKTKQKTEPKKHFARDCFTEILHLAWFHLTPYCYVNFYFQK